MFPLSRRSFLAATAATLAAPGLVRAQGTSQPVRFAVDWTWQSNHSIWTLAQDRGYFAAEKIEASVQRGYGSNDNITKLAGGALDIALVDPNVLAKFNSNNPASQLTSVFIVYDAAPSAVNYLKSSGITKPKDLEGKSIAAAEGDATLPLFLVLARINGVDMNKVKILTVSGQLRDTMVAEKKANASLAFLTTAVLNIAATGIPIDQIGYLQYNKWGLALYSLGITCKKEYAAAHPDVVKGFIRATLKGTKTMLADPKGAVASILRRDSLLNEKVELDRNVLMNNVSLLTPWVREHGMSTVVRERFERSTGQVAEALSLTVRPKMEDIYTDRFLPPQPERMIV